MRGEHALVFSLSFVIHLFEHSLLLDVFQVSVKPRSAMDGCELFIAVACPSLCHWPSVFRSLSGHVR
jgi:hypothetical protein